MQQISKVIGTIILLISLAVLMSWAWSDQHQQTNAVQSKNKTAIFAGGCFWCMEPPFDKLDGVISTVSGYTGGHVVNPTYKQVSTDSTGHFEAVEITYDPAKVDYATLLNVFWHNVDPLTGDGQFCDKGDSYRTAIFYQNEEQRKLAEASIAELVQSTYFEMPIVTQVLPAKIFYPAEPNHQDYYQKNPVRYKYYRFACGRDKRLNELWGELATKPGELIPSQGLAN